MRKLTALLLTIVFLASPAVADSEASYAGIWQDRNYENDYYVIQENGDEMVLIALPGIEASGDTLRFSYGGYRDNLEMSRLSPGTYDDIYERVQLVFESADEGSILPICDTCSAVQIEIVRIF